MSPGTLQVILDTGDPSLIDQAFDQMGVDDLTAYLESLSSPSLPVGVGSQASRTPSTGARTPHRGSPLLSSGARTPHRGGPRLAAAGAGGGGGGGGGSSGGSGGRGRSTPPWPPGTRTRTRTTRTTTSTLSLVALDPIQTVSTNQTTRITPRTLNQADLQRRLRMLLQDQEQLAQGREIANVTMTNSIVTSYIQCGRPTVQSNSSRFSS